MATDSGAAEGETAKKDAAVVSKKRRGLISRIWNGIFRWHGDDFEKRLQHISKEEAAVLARIKRRSHSWRRMLRHLILFSVVFEVIAVGYAIVSTRSLELDWKMRAFRVLPMFLLPALSFVSYSTVVRFMRMCDRKDERTLERLRAERQAKIDELKERTNYYTTQQLIQQYDPDPAAKAAAATVLASKLGADSGLKMYLGDESQLNVPTGKSNDFELVQSSGLRNRKESHMRSSNEGSTRMHRFEGDRSREKSEDPAISENEQLVVNHYNPQGPMVQDGSWIARLAALLVGEDPSQSYALICGNCHMHNGLARKEDFPYITYYCPHCHALNRAQNSEQPISGTASPGMDSLRADNGGNNTRESPKETVSTNAPSVAESEIAEAVEKSAPEESVAS
ncbi:hypothetical protein SAY87_009735 [Trapa incisa]|uniref:Lunapark zinc ribbon domain-containing protein n=1 Tax=Trapa incisa TaxID=236973 RepID=A0AAN7K268_9MYRT|nr:hypothetical protein SAY87_009735 [Trapa incisa]